MRRPYTGSLPITSEYGNRQFWMNGRLVSDFHNGIDVGGIFDVLSADNGYVAVAFTGGRVDSNPNINTPANYIVIDHGNGVVTRYWHLSTVAVQSGQNVSKGQFLGKSGRTGYATGEHLHFEVKKNGVAVNPRDFINFSTDNDSNLSISSSNMEFITVGDGEGLFSVAQRAGLPANEDGARIIYSLNQGWRGSWDWQSLNARMGVGDQLRVKAGIETTPTLTPTPDSSAQIKELQDKIDTLNKTIASTLETKRKEAEELSLKLQQVTDEYKKLEATSIKFNPEGFTNQLTTNIITAITEEAKAVGLKEKWHKWVDSKFKSNFVRQFLKYTWPAWIFFTVSSAILVANTYTGENPILLGLIPTLLTFGASVVQFLLTNFDKNKDGKVDFVDFSDEILKK